MQTFPSQLPFPSLLTFPGIVWVSISSRRNNIPALSRNPTMILGTPRRKDWAQNLSSFRSNLIFSLSLNSSDVVFNSTQLIGSSFRAGFESQTEDGYQKKPQMRKENDTYWHRLHRQLPIWSFQYQFLQRSNIELYCLQLHELGLRSFLEVWHPKCPR